MRRRLVLSLIFVLSISVTAFGQATRTWVSGVGDDANPCSRTAPCKTFAGAISKTAAGGEISVLDPGGYGAVTITKSITIQGADFVASALASGTNAIVINAGPADRVYLRNLSLNGLGTSLSGIRVVSASRVVVENVNIFGFRDGIDIAPSAANVVRIAISNTDIRNNHSLGVKVAPTGSAINGFVFVSLDNVRISGTQTTAGATATGSAVLIDGGSSAHIANSNFAENDGSGIFVRSGSDVSTHNTVIFRNTAGISITGGSVRLFGTSVYANSSGFVISGGTIQSHGNNAINANGGNQTPSSVIGLQ